MKEIQMVDLNLQYEKIKPQVDQSIQQVLNSAAYINGPEVHSFEKNLSSFLNIPHVISCANGTDALQLAFMALKLSPGDEIIIPAFTYIAPVEVAVFLGLKPVLVDVDPYTFNVDTEKVKNAINKKTKAIVAVHLFGQACDMANLSKIAHEYNLFIIEDNAQSIGSETLNINRKKQMTGTIGTIGITSFFPSKNLGCYGDGGAVLTHNNELASMIRMIANHGQEKKYEHSVVGINSRLDTLQAAILDIKLINLISYNKKRQEVASYYDRAFKTIKNIKCPHRTLDSTHVFHQYTLLVKKNKRDELKEHLAKNKIPSMIYYPIPVYLQKAYNFLNYNSKDFPATENLCRSVLSLPMHTELDQEQLDYIAKNILNFFNHE